MQTYEHRGCLQVRVKGDHETQSDDSSPLCLEFNWTQSGSHVWTCSASSFCSSVNFLVCFFFFRPQVSCVSHCLHLLCRPLHCVLWHKSTQCECGGAGCGFVGHIADISPYDTCPAVHLSEIQQWASGADLASESQSPFDGAGSVMDLNSCGVLWEPRLLNSWPLA